MNVFNCSVHSAGAAVDFYGDGYDLASLFSNSGYNCWVPEIEVSSWKSKSGYRVYYHDSEEKSLHFTNHRASINFPWSMMKNGETILYAGYPFIEVQRQMKASATIHAACVALGEHGVLLLGDIGSGKTTLAMRACHELGARLYSNDLAVIGFDDNGLYCSGGTKFFHLRQESVCRSLPEFAHLFQESKCDSWLNKIMVPPEKLNIATGEGITRIDSVYMIHVDDQKPDLYLSSADDMSTRLKFNENLTRYIRNVVTTLLGGDKYETLGYIPSLDHPEFYDWRQKMITYIFETKKMPYLSGPTRKMLQYIASRI